MASSDNTGGRGTGLTQSRDFERRPKLTRRAQVSIQPSRPRLLTSATRCGLSRSDRMGGLPHVGDLKVTCHGSKGCIVVLLTLMLGAVWMRAAGTGQSDETGMASVPLTVGLIEQLSDEMRTNHPAIKAARGRATAAKFQVEGIRKWQDPALKVGGSFNDGRAPSTAEEGDLIYGVEQTLPLFGKSEAARAVAVADAATESERAELLVQLQRRDLSKALFELALADRAIVLGREDLKWLETTLEIANARLQAGTATQLDFIRLQNERARRTNQLATEISRRTESLVTLNRLLARPPLTAFPILTLPEIAPPLAFTSTLIRYATNSEPRLLVASREVTAAEARMRATRKSKLPDMTLGVQGQQFHGDGGFRQGMVTVGFNLPWLNAGRYRKDLARDQHRHDSARQDRQSLALEVVNEIHHRITAIDTARREGLLYRDDILPRSERALAVAMAGWSGSSMEVRDVLETRRMLVEAKSMIARAVAMQWIEMSDLVLCCGLSDLEMLLELGAPETPAITP